MMYDYSFLTKELKKLSSSEFIVSINQIELFILLVVVVVMISRFKLKLNFLQLCLNYLKYLLRKYFGVDLNSSLNKSNSMNTNDDIEEVPAQIFKSPSFLQVN